MKTADTRDNNSIVSPSSNSNHSSGSVPGCCGGGGTSEPNGSREDCCAETNQVVNSDVVADQSEPHRPSGMTMSSPTKHHQPGSGQQQQSQTPQQLTPMLTWDKLSPAEFQQLQDLAAYSNKCMADVLMEFEDNRKLSSYNKDEDIDFSGFKTLLDIFLEVETPEELSRHLFLSFVRIPSRNGGTVLKLRCPLGWHEIGSIQALKSTYCVQTKWNNRSNFGLEKVLGRLTGSWYFFVLLSVIGHDHNWTKGTEEKETGNTVFSELR